ncbi:MAG: alpha/beta hydrolase, partial [Proteobacteria bacterium]|nr:alpha/beta hydrolase [Pseudomonadota bacterium]
MTPLLFLPGMMCDARLFAPQIASLSVYLPVMVSPLVGADTIEKLASNVLQSAPSHFALAGLSMGGIVAMEVVRQAPERVTHLALLDTNPFAENHSVKLRRAPQIQKVRAGRLE